MFVAVQRLSLLFAKDMFLGHECTGEMATRAEKQRQ
jgi:hypothetical protein